MDPRLLDHYNRELHRHRELMLEFAETHKKVSQRMGLQVGDINDTYVDRLIQSSSFVTARADMRLADEFGLFTQALLQTTYPNYITPTPSMSIARLVPGEKTGTLRRGITLPRGSVLKSRIPSNEHTACEFTTSQDITLYPLEVSEARLTGIPPDIPALDRFVPAGAQVQGALRVTLRIIGDASFNELDGVDRLPFYLSGDEAVASHLFELIHAATIASVIGAPGRFASDRFHPVTHDAVVHEALEPEHSLLPAVPTKLHGHNLVQEYFCFPERFWFFTITGLKRAFAGIDGKHAEVVLLLSRPVGHLANSVDATHFALFCSPVINLFPRSSGRLQIDPKKAEHLLIPVPSRPNDFEVHSVSLAKGQIAHTSESVTFYPLHDKYFEDTAQANRYFTLRRQVNRPQLQVRPYGTHRRFTETRTYISLVDGEGRPDAEGMRYLKVDALLTNRDLPSLLSVTGLSDLEVDDSLPVRSIGLLRRPTYSKPPLGFGERAWQLYSQLHLDYLIFEPIPNTQSGEGLRRLLRLYATEDDAAHLHQIEALIGASAKPVNRRLPRSFDRPYGRGIECALTIDETAFNGSPYTLGLVLERYLARHVSDSSFTTTVLRSKQGDDIAQWPPRRGGRAAF
ncbi:type VI secretion system baseplate subunit TssF [Caballeronia sp. LZ062]|uniref:type VI secretion system baseplate subunit TssF n=1 Tax=unclassified Caballeronia TaxID=2646786 RepID=UPI0028646D35|nr:MULTISPECIES: type VI secretion system baseplate subunit TssF [unclassified Caballeronia]MDR5856994.1 type VI secretion system baseplate subunit TssF [Caballeronia sp. LZ050]MDR5869609.1 type VI secretion system baseplate subunit TssF [Caballeronia sp. LZ062]